MIKFPGWAVLVCILATVSFVSSHGMPTVPLDTHPCFRDCPAKSSPMTCGYNFTLEHFWILSKACYDCPNRTSDCSKFDCVPADGVSRGITVVNRMLPGPPIRVCKGDTIVVDVTNELLGEGAAIHWHGIKQHKTPWNDGVPGVTQCPIPPGSTFRYEFEVPTAGSFYWHSHVSLQRGDGVAGNLIVREPKKNNSLYDFDLPEHELLVMDWLADLALPVFLNHHHANGGNEPPGILINGRGFAPGFFANFSKSETLQKSEKRFVPPYEVRVNQGNSYRLRILSNGFLNCPLSMSIDNHTITIIASDGVDIEPVDVESLVIYSGERWDIVIKADQPVGSYWIKFQGLVDCDEKFSSAYQMAVLNYKPLPKGSLPLHIIRNWEEAGPQNKLRELPMPPLNLAPAAVKPLTAVELSSFEDNDPEIIAKEKADHQFYISYDFNPIDNLHFHGSHIPIRAVNKAFKLYTPQLNGISHTMPVSPILTQPEAIPNVTFCNEQTLKKDCTKEYCECVHLPKVKLDSVVELVLVDRGHNSQGNQPFHLHGHSFRVVAMEKLGNSTEPSHVKQRDAKGLVKRRRTNAVIKDTVTVPDGGYTIIRFRADNPGFWFFHSHIAFNVEIGMGLIIQVGNITEFPRTPENFPKCGNYQPNVARPPIRYEENKRPVPTTTPKPPPYGVITTQKSSKGDAFLATSSIATIVIGLVITMVMSEMGF